MSVTVVPVQLLCRGFLVTAGCTWEVFKTPWGGGKRKTFRWSLSENKGVNPIAVRRLSVTFLNADVVFISGIVAMWSLAVLSFERFFVICRPLGNMRLQAKHAVIGLLFVWTFSFVWTFPPVLGWNRYTVSKIGTTCEPDWWAGIHFFTCTKSLTF